MAPTIGVAMDSRTFLGLEPTHNPFRWKLPVTEGISTTGNFLFGGSGLAAAISAMEGTSGRQCVWATAQYLSYAKPGEALDIDVTIAGDGQTLLWARLPDVITGVDATTLAEDGTLLATASQSVIVRFWKGG